jgi:hypothetical protein
MICAYATIMGRTFCSSRVSLLIVCAHAATFAACATSESSTLYGPDAGVGGTGSAGGTTVTTGGRSFGTGGQPGAAIGGNVSGGSDGGSGANASGGVSANGGTVSQSAGGASGGSNGAGASGRSAMGGRAGAGGAASGGAAGQGSPGGTSSAGSGAQMNRGGGSSAGSGGVLDASGGSTSGVEHNLSLSKTATADSEETTKGNLAALGNDGSLSTRWCAADGLTGHHWTVDLGSSHTLTKLAVTWEKAAVYKFKVEGSLDASVWATVLDQTQSMNSAQTQSYPLGAAPNARYVRVTVTGLATSTTWASFFEFVVSGY